MIGTVWQVRTSLALTVVDLPNSAIEGVRIINSCHVATILFFRVMESFCVGIFAKVVDKPLTVNSSALVWRLQSSWSLNTEYPTQDGILKHSSWQTNPLARTRFILVLELSWMFLVRLNWLQSSATESESKIWKTEIIILSKYRRAPTVGAIWMCTVMPLRY